MNESRASGIWILCHHINFGWRLTHFKFYPPHWHDNTTTNDTTMNNSTTTDDTLQHDKGMAAWGRAQTTCRVVCAQVCFFSILFISLLMIIHFKGHDDLIFANGFYDMRWSGKIMKQLQFQSQIYETGLAKLWNSPSRIMKWSWQNYEMCLAELWNGPGRIMKWSW
jgi:hypothetical protein